MNYDEYTTDTASTTAGRRNHLPLMLGLAGVAFGAVSFGFVIANAIGGNGESPATAPMATPPTEVVSTPAPALTEDPAPVEPTPTTIPPTATPVPPTATATVPPISTSKFQDFFRAEGGSHYENTKTLLPFRRAEGSWDNSYKGCPGAGCIRGKVSAVAGLGPLSIGESPSASAQVYNTFKAQRPTANLLMNVKWSGTLVSLASANSNAATEVQVIVSEIDPKTNKVVKALPGMPFTVMSKELGLEAIQGLDSIKLNDSRMVNIPLKLSAGAMYRIDLKVSCNSRAALSISATSCANTAEWTTMAVEYDRGLCSPSQKGEGCIYTKN